MRLYKTVNNNASEYIQDGLAPVNPIIPFFNKCIMFIEII